MIQIKKNILQLFICCGQCEMSCLVVYNLNLVEMSDQIVEIIHISGLLLHYITSWFAWSFSMFFPPVINASKLSITF